MARGGTCWCKAIMDDSKVARIMAIEAISGKRVFAGAPLEIWKQRLYFNERAHWPSPNRRMKKPNELNGIKDDSVSGWSSLCYNAIWIGETGSVSTVITGKSSSVACCWVILWWTRLKNIGSIIDGTSSSWSGSNVIGRVTFAKASAKLFGFSNGYRKHLLDSKYFNHYL